MNTSYAFGFIFGIIVAAILVIVFLKAANTNHKAGTEYDERQQALRGKGYCYGFYAILIYEFAMIFVELSQIRLPIEGSVLHFGGILLGCTVLAGYCIWNDVYWGLNNNPKRYAVLFAALAILNALPVLRAVMEGSLLSDGSLSLPLLNLMVLTMILVIGAELLIKALLDRHMGKGDE